MAFFDPAIGQIKGVAGLISFFSKPHTNASPPAPLLAERVPTAQLRYSFFLYQTAGNL
jgi:hypothetical protein